MSDSEYREYSEKRDCCAKWCYSKRSLNRNLRFHSLPRPYTQRVGVLNDFGVQESWDRRELWIHKLQIKAKKSLCAKVCSKHFVEADYFIQRDSSRRKCLKRNAIPSRNLPKQLRTKQTKLKNNNACTTQDFVPSNPCKVKLEDEMQIQEKPEPDGELKIQETEDQNAIFHEIKIEEEDVVIIKTEDDVCIESDDVRGEIVGCNSEETIDNDNVAPEEDTKAVHEILNAKVMIIDNNAVLVESDAGDVNLNSTDKSVQVCIETFYETILTVTQLFTLTGIANFKILDTVFQRVRERLPRKLEHPHCLCLEDRVLLCLVKSHLKLPTVAVAFFFKISPAAAGFVYKEYHRIVTDVKKFPFVK